MKATGAIKNQNQRWMTLGLLPRLRLWIQLFVTVGLQWLAGRARAGENHLEYRYEYYQENAGRMTVETHSAYFEQRLIDAVSARGEFVYDAISGATPTGAAPTSPKKVPLTDLVEERQAGNLAFDIHLWNQTFSPQIAYSTESDYESLGISLSDAIDLNQKNTTLHLGAAHNFDSVQPVTWPKSKDKESTDFLLGVSQLLSPKTIVSADFTYRTESGYLSDPYRLASFLFFGSFGFAYPENRPRYRESQIVLVSLTQFISPLNASIEGSYRFHHDSYDINSHTVTLTWHQWLGQHVMIEPMFRYYQQSAAYFYAPSFSGLTPGPGQIFSSDYRLSKFESFDYGLQLSVLVTKWLHVNAGYHRYEMHGLDGKTDPAMFPSANVFTAGIQLWF